MTRNRTTQSGFSLIELMVALFLGLIVTLGILQVFISAKSTYTTQNAAAAIQEDARFALTKMVQEIRMVGMFGCLNTVTPNNAAAATFTTAQALPITWVTSSTAGNTLSLITADVGSIGGTPTWTILSNCTSSSIVYLGAQAAGAGQTAFPIRKVVYTLLNHQILTTVGTATSVLIDNVVDFTVLFGVASTATDKVITSYTATPANPALIRTLRLTLTLFDPKANARQQQFSVVAAVRNRMN
ncbi:prepilin-type N-terminal cleavage/methylation domain-containing protein [Pseudomonas sp. HR96]|uniref:PilW family protein n=1 Tax=Pseudomonas sp. HR96 TaxID=1027966 RepID=UPI002A760761|nr:prepilin-type N-terminal cleavage/methylation domain-containing protein [Pseudomonas sp. HR96]WPO99331.1 prepilin-type N-terminal cleavage/methylation domain-containing protein [Pseudomonas sp. HR96]